MSKNSIATLVVATLMATLLPFPASCGHDNLPPGILLVTVVACSLVSESIMGALKRDVDHQVTRAEAAIDAGLAECDRLVQDLQSLRNCAVLFREPDGSMVSLDLASPKGKQLARDIRNAADALRQARQQIDSIGA